MPTDLDQPAQPKRYSLEAYKALRQAKQEAKGRVRIYHCPSPSDVQPGDYKRRRRPHEPTPVTVQEVRGYSVKPCPSGLMWTLKVTLSTGERVYMHGLVRTFGEALRATTYCIAKGDWRPDKY